MFSSVTSISSPANAVVKHLVQLSRKSALREKEQLFVVEGFREVNRAYQSGFAIQQLFFCEDLLDGSIEHLQADEYYEVNRKVYEKIAYRHKSQGLVATLAMKSNQLDDLEFSMPNPLILVVESPEKPGNIGALLRTAAAANLDAIIITDPKTGIYNANCIRASLGGFFAIPIAVCSNEESLDFLRQHQFHVYTALIDENAADYDQQNYQGKTAIVLGTEAEGLSDHWLRDDFQPIQLPMHGKVVDSLNLSVSGGILMYEAIKQRK